MPPIKRKACGSSIPIHAIVPYRIIYTTLEKRFVWNDVFIMMRICTTRSDLVRNFLNIYICGMNIIKTQGTLHRESHEWYLKDPVFSFFERSVFKRNLALRSRVLVIA